MFGFVLVFGGVWWPVALPFWVAGVITASYALQVFLGLGQSTRASIIEDVPLSRDTR
jgi:hypothetical protein